MKYEKPPLSFDEQVQRLKDRGLIIRDDNYAKQVLSNISFYRLRAYTYPFQENSHPKHPFIGEITFEDIIILYDFDRRLRLLVYDAIEKIEVAFRTQIIYQFSTQNGANWHTNPTLFRSSTFFANNYTSLSKEIKRSNETFIKHYKEKYTQPKEPPSWMSLEVTSFGLLSMMFSNLKRGKAKKAVVRHFGLKDIELLENWMHSFCDIRNICAHHGRLWNRRLTTHINFPTSPLYTFISYDKIKPFKLYAALSAMVYILNIISPDNSFKKRLYELIDNSPLNQVKELGFPDNWKNEEFWKIK